MGKWEAREATDGSGWDVSKDTGNGIVAIVNFDQDEVFIMDESQATRYARALNIVDAGVDIQNMIPKPKLEVRCLSGDDVDSGFEHEEQSDWMLYVNGKPLSSDDVWTCGEAVSRGQDLLVALGIDQSGGITVIADAVEGDTTKEDI